jgi:hypothetical protein
VLCAVSLLLTLTSAISWPVSFFLGLHVSRRYFDVDVRQGLVTVTLFNYDALADTDDDDDDDKAVSKPSKAPVASPSSESRFLGIQLAQGSLRNGVRVRLVAVPHYYVLVVSGLVTAWAWRRYRATGGLESTARPTSQQTG